MRPGLASERDKAMDDEELAPGMPRKVVEVVVERALEEDLGNAGDVTTASTVAADAIASANLVPRLTGVVAGLPVAGYVFVRVSLGRLRVVYGCADCANASSREVLASIHGPVRDIH